MHDYVEQLTSFPLFYDIKKEDLLPMLSCLGSYTKSYSKNEIIFLESQNIRSIGIILNGTVHMMKEDSHGNETLITYLKQKEIFGETFVCGSQTYAHVSFIAATACTVLFLPFHKVVHSCTMSCLHHHRLIENMIRLISDKNVLLMNKVEIISKKTLREKILAYLTLQSEKFHSHMFTIPLGRIELANYLCTDRSALTRELSLMKKDGIIDYEKNTFQILTPESLDS